MRKLNLFSTLLSLWFCGAHVSQGMDGVPSRPTFYADRMGHQGGLGPKTCPWVNDLQGATTLVLNAVAGVETSLSTVQELMTKVAKALIDHDDGILRFVNVAAGKYLALAALIARGAAYRPCDSLRRGIWDFERLGPHHSANVIFFDDYRATGSLELLNNQRTESDGDELQAKEWSSRDNYQQWSNGRSANPSATSGSTNSPES